MVKGFTLWVLDLLFEESIDFLNSGEQYLSCLVDNFTFHSRSYENFKDVNSTNIIDF